MFRLFLLAITVATLTAVDSFTVVCLEKVQDLERKVLYATLRNGTPEFAVFVRGNSDVSLVYDVKDPDAASFAISINLDSLDAELVPATFGSSLALQAGGRAVLGSNKGLDSFAKQLGTSRLTILAVGELPPRPTRESLLRDGFIDTIGKARIRVP